MVNKCSLMNSKKRLLGRLLILLGALSALLAPSVGQCQFFFNDDFENAAFLGGPSGTIFDSSILATAQTNEPSHGGPGGASVWYAWTAVDNSTAVFDTFGSGFDTLLAAYTGTDLTNLIQIAANDDAAGRYQSRISFSAVAGTTYFIAVDGLNGQTGSIQLNWTQATFTTNNPAPNLGEIQFSAANYGVNENIPGYVTITVQYGGGAVAPVQVDYFTIDGSATAANGDYLTTSGTLTFDIGETDKTFDIQINDNAAADGNRTFYIGLQNPSGASLNAFSTAGVTIVDDESLPVVSDAGQFNFSSSFYTMNALEGTVRYGGQPEDVPGVIITVNRTGGSVGKVLVDCATVSNVTGTNVTCFSTNRTIALPGCDYILVTNRTLVFDNLQTSTNFVVTNLVSFVAFGSTNDLSKSFQVILYNPRPDPSENPNLIVPTIGSGSSATVRILANNFGFNIVNANYRQRENGGNVNFRVWLFGFTGGSVLVHVDSGESFAQFYSFPLHAGSDYADDATRTFPNTAYSDGANTIVNQQDFNPFNLIVTFPQPNGDLFLDIPITLLNDNIPEFNEDIRISLERIPNNPPVGFGQFANATILNEDPAAGSADPQWNPANVSFTNPPFYSTPGANNVVYAVAVQDDQKTLIGGDFTAYNSETRRRIARINQNGSLDESFNPGNGANDFVNDVAVYLPGLGAPNLLGKIMIVGAFTSLDNLQANHVARLNSNGILDSTFVTGDGANGLVRSVAIQRDGKVVLVGEFSSFNNVPSTGIIRLNTDGSVDDTFLPGAGANGSVWSVALADNTTVIGTSATSQPFAFSATNQIPNVPNSATVTVNYDFQGAQGNLRIYYAGIRIFETNDVSVGTTTVAYGPGIATDLFIIVNEGQPGNGPWQYTAQVVGSPQASQKIVFGGDFTTYDGFIRNGIVRLNPDGSVDQTFDPGGGTDGPVYAVAAQPDLKILIGGAFSDLDFRNRNGIARLNVDGSLDTTFDPGEGANDVVYTIKLQPDGKPVIGGLFTAYNQTRRIGLARLFVNGLLDTSFMDTAYNQFAGLVNKYSFQPPNFISSLALETNGNVMIGGSFTNLGGHAFGTGARTRQDQVVRFNVARVLGGYTPGPGNVEFTYPTYTVDENAGSLAVQLERVDGRLGTVGQDLLTTERLAQASLDYTTEKSPTIFPEYNFVAPRSVGRVGPVWFTVPIKDDLLIEWNEILDLSAIRPSGSITLGGEIIPLGGARGRSHAPLTITDNDFQKGTLAFSAPLYTVTEGGGFATITVVRTNGNNGAVTVDYYVRSGSATAGLDFTPATNTLHFGPGEISKTFQVPIIPDTQVEFDETVSLVLTNATGGAILPGGLPTSFARSTLQIIDDDFAAGRLNFASTNFIANEGTNGIVKVTRTGGTQGGLSVQVNIAGGILTTSRVATLTWTNGDSSTKSIVVGIGNDLVVNSNEVISLTLQNPSVAGAIGGAGTATMTIIDNDSFGSFVFSQANYETEENGTNAIITVVRTNGIAGYASVQIGIADGTATINQDYRTNGINSFVFIFAPGQTSTNFPIGILNDTLSEGTETVLLSLLNPLQGNTSPPTAPGQLGLINSAVLNIIDDEDSNIPAGSLDTTFSSLAGPNSAVYALALQETNGTERVLIGGDFTTVNNVTRSRLARLLPDGNLDPTFDAGQGPNRPVRALALQPGGKILLGGFFTRIQGTNRAHIARLNFDGSLDAFFDPGAGTDNPVYAIGTLPDGRVVIGGGFTTFNDISRPGVAVLNTNGTLSLEFNTGVGVNGVVYAIAVQPDGKILIGGEFTTVDNFPRTRIARLNTDGSVDQTFDPGLGADATVRALALEPTGRIIVGGSFTSMAGTTRSYLARINPDGSLDANFLSSPSATGGNDAVYALALQQDGKILAGGEFTIFNGVSRHRITRLESEEDEKRNIKPGDTDPSVNFGSGANSFVVAIAVQQDRRIVIGGGFTIVDDQVRNYVARLFGGSLSGPGQFEFTTATYDVDEFAGGATITVRRRGGTTGAAQISYLTSGGTATPGSDYTNAVGTLNFPQGEVEASFSVGIINDTEVEAPETVGLTLTNPAPAGAILGFQSDATLTIISDDSLIHFKTATFRENENAVSGHAIITVVRDGATNSTATVDYATQDGTAGPQDYFPAAGTLTFLPGEKIKTFTVDLVNDLLVEGDETVLLSLANVTSSGSVYLGLSSAILTIVDNDFASGLVSFSQTEYGVAEIQTNRVITVRRANGSTGVISVDYRTFDGSAIAGQDYISAAGTLTFADGETLKTFNVPVIYDSVDEGNETVFLVLTNARAGATIGNANATLIITNSFVVNGVQIVAAGSVITSESGPVNGNIDPNETVSVSFGLRNVGSLDALNVTATLLATNGVTPFAPVSSSYGNIVGNGPVISRTFSFKATGVVGGTVTANLRLTSGGSTIAVVPFTFVLGRAQYTFSNPAQIIINDFAPATPFPSSIQVSGISGVATKVSVTLSNISHTYPDDIDIMLVGPQNKSVILMSDAGSTSFSPNPINNVTLTFEDDAPGFLSDTDQIVSGRYLPTNYQPDSWPAPIPPDAPTQSTLLTPGPQDPNGTWRLFVVDDARGDVGVIANGWSLTLAVTDSGNPSADVAVFGSASPNPVTVGNNLTYALAVTNFGPATAHGILLTNILAPETTFLTCDGVCTNFGNQLIVCSLPDLASGSGVVVHLTVQANGASPGATTISSVSALQGDPNTANNVANIITVIDPVATMSVQADTGARVISWPTGGGSGWTLETSQTMQPGSWVPIHPPVSIDGVYYKVVLGPTNDWQFFRLRRQ